MSKKCATFEVLNDLKIASCSQGLCNLLWS